MIRLHVDHTLGEGARVELGADQARYLLTVMRLQTDEAVLLFNGRDGEWRARLAETSKRACVLQVEERTREQAGVPDVELVIALVKRARLETIVEKATELGTARVRLVITRRTNADHTNVGRLQAIATEAAEQTERLDVPEIVAPEKLDRLLDRWDAGRKLMFCDEGDGFDEKSLPSGGRSRPEGRRWGAPAEIAGSASEAPPAQEAAVASSPPSPAIAGSSPQGGEISTPRPALDALRGCPAGPWAILIGPEGGFDPAERARLRELSFVTPVTLGPRILRADTAAISALTLWQAALGDWN